MIDLIEKVKGTGRVLKAHERHISAASMVGGFVFDSLTYGRVDHAITQIVLLAYLSMAAGSILWLHFLESHPERAGNAAARLRSFLPAATQFAFGTLWSAFLVFYTRSGVLSASWPFFLVLLAIFVGNEALKSYHARLIFTSTLFAFALLSYAIFMVPVFTHTIGEETFVGSGVAAVLVYWLYLAALSMLGAERWRTVRKPVLFGAGGVLAAIYALYFLDVLPPLPLAMQKAGVYDSVRHAGGAYYVASEKQSWRIWVGAPTVVHVAPGGSVYAFAAIFAPVKLVTRVRHVWRHYDPDAKEWNTVETFSYAISGGRAGGYRGYTRKSDPAPGRWHVDVETVDGRLIGRLRFKVESGAPAALTKAVIR